MTNACVENVYFSGQGAILISKKDPTTGNPLGFLPVGNCASAEIGIDATIVNHKETCTGSRSIDMRLTTQIVGNVKIAMESFFKENLAYATFGDSAALDGAANYSQTVGPVQQGHWYGLDFLEISNIDVTDASGVDATAGSQVVGIGGAATGATTTGLTNDGTIYEATITVDGGSPHHLYLAGASAQTITPLLAYINFVLGATATAALAAGNIKVTSATTGVASTILIADTGGNQLFSSLTGFTAIAAAVPGVAGTPGSPYTIDTDYLINADAGSIYIVVGGGIPDDSSIGVEFDYPDQVEVEAIMRAFGDEVWVRFEGLNTLEENSPVVVDVFRFQFAPLASLSLIGDTFAQMAVEGLALRDATRQTGSQYFRWRAIDG